MTSTTALLLNIALFSIFPLYLTTLEARTRSIAFYIYISVLLVLGGFLGSIYSFSVSEDVIISGGSVAYGAFIMSTVMLIIVEQNTATFRNMVRLVVLVDIFVFLVFNFLSYILNEALVMNPLAVSPVIFDTSLWVLVLGGVLILAEFFLLFLIFLQVRKFTENIPVIAFSYTVAFILILCFDGIAFPLLAMGTDPGLLGVIVGNLSGKLFLALCYSIPMLLFYFIFSRNLVAFVGTPLKARDLIYAPKEQLLEELHRYELRDEKLTADNKALIELSTTDALTGLANRRQYEQTMATEWSRCAREGASLALVIGDIDYFKQYNDSYGHQRGDECLKDIAELWQTIFHRPSDLAARIGGEEFACIVPGTTAEQCARSLREFNDRLKSVGDTSQWFRSC